MQDKVLWCTSFKDDVLIDILIKGFKMEILRKPRRLNMCKIDFVKYRFSKAKKKIIG